MENGNIIYEPTIRLYGSCTDLNGLYNALVKLKGFDFWFRGRSEMLVLNSNNEVFLELRKDKTYKIPGGSWDKNESYQSAAERETMEEARMIVKDVMESISYGEIREPSSWVYDKIPEKYIWHGYYTKLFIGRFDRRFNGHIDEHDLDSLERDGRFYNINKVWGLLKEPHKIALKNYLQS